MRNKILGIILFIVIFSVCIAWILYALRPPAILQEVQNVVGSKIDLCLNDMMKIGGTDKDTINYKKIVVFTDSSQCTSCQLNAIMQWRTFMELTEKDCNKIKFYFIFHPSKGHVQSVIKKVKDIDLNAPIYIDADGIFLLRNPQIPRASRLHTMLLDENNMVLIIGNPIINDKIEKLYKDAINNCIQH